MIQIFQDWKEVGDTLNWQLKKCKKEKKIKQEKMDAVNNQINELGRIPVQKGYDCTIICDGATMKCSMGIFGEIIK
jgi:hypothetical protein